jgi:hypothetical protein
VSTGPDLVDETLFVWGGTDPGRGVEGSGLAYLDRAALELVSSAPRG